MFNRSGCSAASDGGGQNGEFDSSKASHDMNHNCSHACCVLAAASNSHQHSSICDPADLQQGQEGSFG